MKRKAAEQTFLELKIERWPIERLIPFAKNSRTHSDAQIAEIAGSIAAFGFVNPVLVGPDQVIVAGHARVLAARKLGLTEVPVIVLGHLSETQRRALVIADNRLALNAGWDESMLALELAALREEDFNLDVLGFEDEELARLLASQDPAEGLTDEDTVPDVPAAPVSKTADLWSLGNHRLLVGDATAANHVQRLMDGEAADLVFTDPPYNVDYEGYTEERLKIKG
jgi:ParB-like chromosome segregation protein Spo0J